MTELGRREFDKELWMERANCKGRQKEFYDTTSRGRITIAKQICTGCTVQRQCLAYSLLYSSPEDELIWGGQSKSERRQIRNLGNLSPNFLDMQENILRNYSNTSENKSVYASSINNGIESFSDSIHKAFAKLRFAI